ncbi:MAG TPA: glycosyltransferase [Oligoflexia bacterium]|mgnify:CR=1 FL=1|nr:glycosyltransferase [Oligoflexia bacterium]HMP47808.1 glycosyltransferase [Oligoflexia bacterium]
MPNNNFKYPGIKDNKIRVLVQARSDLIINPGGDGVLLDKSSRALAEAGVDITVDIEGIKNPRDYDIVHLYNFATPKALSPLAEKAYNLNIPYVVTTLYEDRAQFYGQMHVYLNILYHYVTQGQKPEWKLFEKVAKSNLVEDPTNIINDNIEIAKHSEALISSGTNETLLLARDFSFAKKIYECNFSPSIMPLEPSSTFESTYQIKDYILSVGRVEARKNQGMLMAALENDTRPLVIVAGKISYNPEYEKLLRNFKRKGRTLFIKNLSPSMLASAYAGARVHALPSWYELPGLVTLEAAASGTNVVASFNKGTIENYLGNKVHYCDPGSADSILNAINNAWNKPKDEELSKMASMFTWDKTASQLYNIYEKAISSYHQRTPLKERMEIKKANPDKKLDYELCSRTISRNNILDLLK